MNINEIQEKYTKKLTKEVLNEELIKAQKGLILSLIQENFYQNKVVEGEDKMSNEQNLITVNRNLKYLKSWVQFLEDKLRALE
jgi:hypothetical protein